MYINFFKGQIMARLQLTLRFIITSILIAGSFMSMAQSREKVSPVSKEISSDLFGLFFEDINYAADGGLYAELVQNRSFEYNPASNRDWNSFSFWEYVTPGFSYGTINVDAVVDVASIVR